MDRSRLVALVVGAVVALLFVTVATSEPARFAERQPSLPWELPEFDAELPALTTVPLDESQPDRFDTEPSEGWERFTDMLQIAVLAILAVAVAHLLRRAWQHRPRLRWRSRPSGADFDVLDDVADAVVADAEEQHAALRRGEPRNGIVECWLRLETIVEDAGVLHDPALTATEFTADVLDRFDVDANATTRLAALYREARFSSHPMDEHHRRNAVAALDAIHAGLRPARTVSAS